MLCLWTVELGGARVPVQYGRADSRGATGLGAGPPDCDWDSGHALNYKYEMEIVGVNLVI